MARKLTLLEMTQNILSAMDSDEVNSITDTVESLQVAEVIRETYDELFANVPMPEFKALTQLEGLADTDKPNYMKIPDDVDKIDWIKYDYDTDSATDYHTITYLTPAEFFELTAARASASDVIEVEDDSGVRLWIFDNQNPSYWTTFDDEYIVFDGYDADLDSTLQESKSLIYATKNQTFTMEDDFTPHLDTNLFPYLLAEAKSVCFANLKQMPSPKEEQRSRRQRVRSQNDLWRAKQRVPGTGGPDYGRRRR